MKQDKTINRLPATDNEQHNRNMTPGEKGAALGAFFQTFNDDAGDAA